MIGEHGWANPIDHIIVLPPERRNIRRRKRLMFNEIAIAGPEIGSGETLPIC
jgi:hypothetical protein